MAVTANRRPDGYLHQIHVNLSPVEGEGFHRPVVGSAALLSACQRQAAPDKSASVA